MAPRKEVPLLEELCLQCLQSHVTKLILNYANNSQQRIPIEKSKLNETIQTYVYRNLPLNTHDRFVELRLLQLEKIFELQEMHYYLSQLLRDKLLGYRVEYLEEVLLSADFRGILKLIVTENYGRNPRSTDNEQIIKDIALFKYLMSPVTLLNVRSINMGDRPSSRRHATQMSMFSHPDESVIDLVLVILLQQMTKLEVFSGSGTRFQSVIGWRSKVATNVKKLANLTSFTLHTCSDEILAAVSENCKSIREIDVHSARHVSDNCIEHLTKCEMLRTVILDGTAVSGKGFFKLLTQSKSTDLRYVSGLHEYVNEILDQMQSSRVSFPPSQLRQLCYSGVEANHLNLVSRYFPHLTELSLEFKSIINPDEFNFSSILSTRFLRNVALKFSCEDFHKVRIVISKCRLVTSLTLQQGFEPNASDLNSLLLDTIALCPNVEKLTIKQSKMNGAFFDPRVRLMTNPFKHLTVLVWSTSMTIPFAQYILCHAVNIESFEFSSRPPYEWPRIADRFFESIFQYNPLKELRYLSLKYGHNLSMNMLRRIISSCEKLKFLRINVPRADKETLQAFIAEHNYDVVSHIDTDCAWFR